MLKQLQPHATEIVGYAHAKKLRRLEDLGLAQILSTGRSSTVAVLTSAGELEKARL
jgi:hypothetical protein